MPRIHLTAEYQQDIASARAADDHARVRMLTVDAMRYLTGLLARDEIGFEWFSSETKAVLHAAGW